MKPRAYLVHAQYPFADMKGPIDGGLPRTPLWDAEQIAAMMNRTKGFDGDPIDADTVLALLEDTEHP